MPRPKTVITKAELARILELSPGRITQLIAQGMPVRADGRINEAEARAWYEAAIRRPYTARQYASARCSQPESPQRTISPLIDTAVEHLIGARGLTEFLRMLKALGLSDRDAYMAAEAHAYQVNEISRDPDNTPNYGTPDFKALVPAADVDALDIEFIDSLKKLDDESAA